MKKIVLLIFVLTMISSISEAQITSSFYIIYQNKKVSSEPYFKTSTFWIIPTPLAFVKKEFSPDMGRSWERVGIFGENLRPYIDGDSKSLKSLNLYTTTRLLGVIQMFAVTPYFLSSEDYFVVGIISLLTGSLTYHLLSKPFLKKALANHNFINDIKEDCIITQPSVSFDYNYDFRSPMLSVSWNF